MVKNQLLLSYFLLLISGSIISQNNWIKPGAEWHYDLLFAGGWRYEHMYYEKDTLIKGKTCQILKLGYYRPDPLTNKLKKSSYPVKKYIYSNADTVFWFHTNEFHVLYNFAAKVGDSWELVNEYPGWRTIVTVSKIDTVVVNNLFLRRFKLIPSNGFITLVDMVERIGSLSYFFPEEIIDTNGFNDYIIKDLHCYSDNTYSTGDLGANNWPHNCDAHVYIGMDEIESNKFKIYPNPVREVLHIEGYHDFTFKVYDGLGAMVYTGFDTSEIDVSGLPDGLYFLILMQKDGTIYNQSFIKK